MHDKNKYQGKYRVKSARLQDYDYSKNGAYFITIITKDRQPYFGNIINNRIILSEIGKLALKYWFEIPQHFKFVRLDKMVVMPDHIHGILWIVKPHNNEQPNERDDKQDDKQDDKRDDKRDNKRDNKRDVETPKLGVSTNTPNTNTPNTNTPNTNTSNKNHHPEWKPATIGVIINQYKRICTINARKIIPDFGWQSRFHDRIIRNKNELKRIRKYIKENPVKWNNNHLKK